MISTSVAAAASSHRSTNFTGRHTTGDTGGKVDASKLSASSNGSALKQSSLYPPQSTRPPAEIMSSGTLPKSSSSTSRSGVNTWSQQHRLQGIDVVKLSIPQSADLGIELSGGSEYSRPVQVASLHPDGVAYRSGCIDVGDVICLVNGIDVTQLRQHDVTTLLEMTSRQPRRPLVLTLRRSADPVTRTSSGRVTRSKRIEIMLEMGTATATARSATDDDSRCGGFGLVLRCGTEHDTDLGRHLTVSRVIPDSPADREGTIRRGDRIVSIDGIDVTRCSLLHATSLLNCRATALTNRRVVFVVQYDVNVHERVETADGSCLIDVEKPRGTVLDVTVKDDDDIHDVMIDSIYDAGTADRSGLVHVGDRILAVDGVETSDKSAAEVASLISSNRASHISLRLMSASTARLLRQHRRVASHARSRDGGGPSIKPVVPLSSSLSTSSSSSHEKLEKVPARPEAHLRRCVPGFSDRLINSATATVKLPTKAHSLAELSAVHSTRSAPGGVLRLTVEIPTDLGPLGVTIVESMRSTAATLPGRKFFIAAIDDGSFAAQTSTLRVGDGVLAINGVSLEDKNLDEVARLLDVAERRPTVILTVCRTVSASATPTLSRTDRISKKSRLVRQNSVDIPVAPWDRDVTAVASSNENNSTSNRDGCRRAVDSDVVEADVRRATNIKSSVIHDAENSRLTEMLPVADQFVQHERTLANNVNGPRELDPATATCDLDLSTSYDVSRSQQGHGSINNETVTSSVYKLTSSFERPNQTTPTATSTRVDVVPEIHRVPTTDDDDDDDDDSSSSVVENHVNELDQRRNGARTELSAAAVDVSINSQLSRLSSPGDAAASSPSPPDAKLDIDEAELNRIDELLDSIFTPTPVELVKIVLYRRHRRRGILRSRETGTGARTRGDGAETGSRMDSVGSSSDADCGSASSAEGATSCNDDDDYGFSLSDGVYEKGVYVSALRPCSPAAAPGGLQLFDRILQVNSTKVKDMDCHQVAPLIARSPANQVQLIVCRNALRSASLPRQPLPDNATASSPWKPRGRVTFVEGTDICRNTIV